MPFGTAPALPDSDCDSSQNGRRRAYDAAFRSFSSRLTPSQRKSINGSASPDWQDSRTFALPVTADSPAYRTESEDEVIEALREIAALKGALPKMALFISDQMGGIDLTRAFEQFRTAIARICDAKDARIEACMVSLAIGLNLGGSVNGFRIAQHFGLSPQTLHEMLAETCKALGLPKPLSKVKKARYRDTQYAHNLRKKTHAQ